MTKHEGQLTGTPTLLDAVVDAGRKQRALAAPAVITSERRAASKARDVEIRAAVNMEEAFEAARQDRIEQARAAGLSSCDDCTASRADFLLAIPFAAVVAGTVAMAGVVIDVIT